MTESMQHLSAVQQQQWRENKEVEVLECGVSGEGGGGGVCETSRERRHAMKRHSLFCLVAISLACSGSGCGLPVEQARTNYSVETHMACKAFSI